MTAYYNEIDEFAAQWLLNLIAANVIAPGEVDTRSIKEVAASDLIGFNQCHFFAGIGVWSYAARRAGITDDRPFWSGSCPCQPFSAAGKGGGLDDERHLWPDFFRLIRERQPPRVYGEQVASKDAEPWLDLVQDDMEAVGYAFGAVAFPSAGVGAPHIRDRTYWAAYRSDEWRRVADANGRDARAEGLQRGREHGFEPQDGRPLGAAGPFKSYSEWFGVCWHPSCRDSERRGCICHTLGAPTGWRWDSENGWLDDAERAGLEGLAGHGDDRDEPGRDRAGADRSASEASADRGVADAENGTGWTGERGEETGAWPDGLGRGRPSSGGPDVRMADTNSGDAAQERAGNDAIYQQRAPFRGWSVEPAGVGARGGAFGRHHSAGGDEVGASDSLAGMERPGPLNGFWRNADWLLCRDGRWRPVEPGTFPLAHGVAGRVGRLRAYGNAINAEAAAEFLRCCP